MVKNKKGVEMSLNVIIIAAIGLLILVILAVLIVTYVNKTRNGIEACSNKAGTCSTPGSCSGDNVISAGSGLKMDCENRNDGKTQCCKIFGSATG